MKKIFFSLIVIIVLIVSSIYGLLFTKSGNKIISSYLEQKINEGREDAKLEINDFRLTFDTLNFEAKIDDNSIINISGNLSIFKKNVDLKYDIKINDLSTLKNITNQNFKGYFSTSGVFRGNNEEAIIQGISDIALSQTNYYLKLVDFRLKNIYLELKEGKIEELLSLLNKPIYAKGILTINADIKNIAENYLEGAITTNISKGKINNEIVNKEFDQTIQTPITFKSDLSALLLGKNLEVKSEINTSLFDFFMGKTTIDLEKEKIISDYKLDISNLNKLEGVIGKKLNGDLLATGNILVEDSIITINGTSNVFESSTSYNLKLNEESFQGINLKIENARIENFLKMLNEPVYATGNLEIQANVKNANLDKLDGSVVSKINDAKIINEVVNTVFDLEIKEIINFDLQADTTLVPNQLISKALLKTNLGDISVDKASYDLRELSFDSDYLIKIPSLIGLKDFTKVKLRGNMDIKGKIHNKNSSVLINGNSNILGGVLDFNLKNDDLNVKLNDINIKELFYMLNQSEIFNSKANFNLDYNLLSKKGDLNGKLINGHFLANDFSNFVKLIEKVDLTKEIYEDININSNIEQSKLTSTIIMKSKDTKIEIKDSILDLEQNTINARLDTKIKDNIFAINLTGDINQPKISLDAKEILKNFQFLLK